MIIMKNPPDAITIRFCPTCGRDDRFGSLGYGSHFSGGKRCPGTVGLVTYAPVPVPEPSPQLVHADELKPGDHVLVECEIFDDPEDYPEGAHVHARPLGLWFAGDQYVGTWKSRMDSHPDPWAKRV